MNFKFQPEYFDSVALYEISAKLLSEHCNALLEAHLKTLPRVYGRLVEGVSFKIHGVMNTNRTIMDNHTALLWDVQPIGEKDGDA